jgi:cupin superfamily acireductone dioxygenase involved in methionine salvage
MIDAKKLAEDKEKIYNEFGDTIKKLRHGKVFDLMDLMTLRLTDQESEPLQAFFKEHYPDVEYWLEKYFFCYKDGPDADELEEHLKKLDVNWFFVNVAQIFSKKRKKQ